MPQTTRNELRLFISSTFHDLQEERGYLIKHVFPQIRALCRQRGIEFTEIDLRWGLTAEESTLGKVIRTCLEEIDNCKPYFLGLLGSRYGWVPNLAEVQKDYQLLQKYPWVEDAAVAGASLVEIEFMLGLKNAQVELPGTLIYAIPEKGKPKPQDAKLGKLRQTIIDSGVPFKTFATVEELGAFVLHDLTSIIERDWPEHFTLGQLEIERALQEAFGATRRKAYIANPRYIRALEDQIKSTGTPLCIHAESGAGKSALMSYFAHYYQRNNPAKCIITHFVGASPSAVDGTAVLRHLLLEIRERFQIVDPLPETRQEMIDTLPKWLAGISEDPIVIMIDAVNQLDGADSALGWLPEYLPPNIRLIVSTITGETSESLEKAGYQLLQLRPLEGEEREALIVRFLGEYHKGLSREQLKRVTGDHKASSPLFLRTMLEELRLSGEFELLDETIDHFQSARDINELFQFVLERMENDYGVELVSRVMAFIAHSRQGLSEPELIELTQCDRYALSVFLIALDYHLMKPNGRYAFFHDYLRNAVLKRYLRNPAIARECHKALANYFSTQPMSRRRIEEEPWQWMKAGLREELLISINSVEALELFTQYDKVYELLRYWNDLELPASEYVRAAQEELKEFEDKERYANFLWQVGRVFVTASFFAEAELLFKEAVEVQTALLGADDVKTAEIMSDLGALWQQLGRYAEAEAPLRKSLAIIEKSYGQDNPLTADAMSNLATLLYRKREFEEAELLFSTVLRIREQYYGASNPKSINTVADLASILWERGDMHGSRCGYEEALRLSERQLGVNHPCSTQLMNNLGAVARVEERHQDALEYFRYAAQANLLAFGPKNAETLQYFGNAAVAFKRVGRYEESEKIYHDVIPKMTEVFGVTHLETLNARNNYAFLLMEKGAMVESEQELQAIIAIRDKVYGTDDLASVQANLNYANFLTYKNAHEQARDIFGIYLPKKIAILGENHPSVQSTKRDFEKCVN